MGLEIVRRRLEELGGEVHLQSTPGRGSRFELRVPIRLLTARTLLVQCGDYRAGLPIHTAEGTDVNRDGNANDSTVRAYRYSGLSDGGIASFEEIGACGTVNCSRRAPFSQLNLRVSRGFTLGGSMRIEAIAEVFNLFNAINPSLPLVSNRVGPNGPLSSFMQPTAYAGDFGQPEQRVGQLGFRLTF
jgi:hypothetical protein